MSPAPAPPSAQSLLAAFESAAASASATEAALRKRLEAEILGLERQRAFAHRRLNFMRLLSDSVQSADSEDDAVASGRAVVRAELGWQNESEAREETLAQLSPVIAMTFNCVCSTDAQQSASEVVKALAEFESWYEARFERAFWVLLEQQVEDLPLVER